MSDLSWTTVEDAVVAALQARLGEQAGTIQSYQGNWKTDLPQATWRMPAVLVMLNGSNCQQVGVSSFDLTLDFQVLVVVRSLRGEEAGRRGTGGAYDLLLGVQDALWQQDLGLGVLPLPWSGKSRSWPTADTQYIEPFTAPRRSMDR